MFSDEKINVLPLMGSPVTIITIILAYLWFVFKAGPNFMKNRQPYNLTTIIRLYNIFQVAACIYFVATFHSFGFTFKYTWQCSIGKVPFLDHMLSHASYYLMLRIVEFVETVFFVLRKKHNQVSGLHVYHHISTVVVFWTFIKYNLGRIC